MVAEPITADSPFLAVIVTLVVHSVVPLNPKILIVRSPLVPMYEDGTLTVCAVGPDIAMTAPVV